LGNKNWLDHPDKPETLTILIRLKMIIKTGVKCLLLSYIYQLYSGWPDVMTPKGGNRDYLRCLLNGGYPSVPGDITNEKDMEIMHTISELHKRVALLEMTKHEFPDKNYRKEHSTFSDGTTITIDKDADTFEIFPELK